MIGMALIELSHVTNADLDRRIQCAARAYMLYLASCTLFSDKSGTWVSTDYLKLFEDLGQVLAFAWGCYISIHVHAVTVCFKRWSEAG